MFEIKLNDQLRVHIRELNDSNANTGEFDVILKKDCISMEALIKIYEEYWQKQIPLSLLLRPLEFHFKPRRILRSNYKLEFKEHLRNLRLQQQEKEYQQLICRNREFGSFDDKIERPLTLAQVNHELKEQITTVFNILVSVISVSFALWYWSGSSSGMALHYRILISLFFGILVLIAEVVVYNSYLQRISDARTKEKLKKEKKKIVERFVI